MEERPRGRARRLARILVVDSTPLRTSVRYRWLFVGQVGTVLSRQILIVAVPYQVFVLTESSWLVGVIGLVQIAPLLVCSILGGTAADAFDRQKLLIAVQLLMAITSIGMAINGLGEPRIWLIFVLMALNGGLAGAEAPTRTAMIPTLLPRDQLASGFALNQTLNQTGQIVGPALAGLMIARLGLAATFWVAAASVIFTALVLLPIGSQRPDGASGRVTIHATGEGWRYLRSKPLLQQLMLIDLNAMVFGMPRALFPVIGLVALGGDASTVGMLHAAPGIGALAAAGTTGWVRYVRRHGRAVVFAVFVWGAAIVAFGLSRNLGLAVSCLAVAGGADVLSNVFRTTLIQLLVPDHLRGRLSSFKVALSGAGPRLGDAEAGAVATLTTPTFSVVSGGVLSILGTWWIVWRGRDIWHHSTDLRSHPTAADGSA